MLLSRGKYSMGIPTICYWGFVILYFQYSKIPKFPPGRRPNGPEANWSHAPKFVSI
jgi:hypothetical protein